MQQYDKNEMEKKQVYDVSNEVDMAYLKDQYAKGNVQIGEEMQKRTGNRGWKYIAEKVEGEYELGQFEEMFSRWQKQAILLTEISCAKTYHFVTLLGVFTHIGTLARALQYIFEKDWEISTSLAGDELTFLVNKGIADISHSLKCTFVELDQAYSDMHMNGWKFSSAFGLAIPRKALVPMAKCLLDIATDTELEGCSQLVGEGRWYAHVEKKGENAIVLSLPTGESLFGTPAVDTSPTASEEV